MPFRVFNKLVQGFEEQNNVGRLGGEHFLDKLSVHEPRSITRCYNTLCCQENARETRRGSDVGSRVLAAL